MRAPFVEWRAARRVLPAAALGAVLCTGCGLNTAPPQFLPAPDQAQREAFGGWVEAKLYSLPADSQLDGELIAISTDSIWILTGHGGRTYPTAAVESVKLTTYSSQATTLALWGVAGGVASIPLTGAYSVFLFPTWMIAGAVSGSHQASKASLKSDTQGLIAMARFARFPQGMPRGVKLSDLTLPKRNR